MRSVDGTKVVRHILDRLSEFTLVNDLSYFFNCECKLNFLFIHCSYSFPLLWCDCMLRNIKLQLQVGAGW